MRPSELLQDTLAAVGAIRPICIDRARERADDIYINDDDYRPLPDDVSEKSFTERMFDDPVVWANHCCEAIMPSENATTKVLAILATIRAYEGSPDEKREACRQLGEAIYEEVLEYCRVLGDE